jgi:Flp pilus assembly pilin Flp
MKHTAHPARHRRGQASVEYVVVTACIATALLVAGEMPLNPVDTLSAAFKSLFSAYSFSLSLP